jgi:hypothetical protein
LNETNPIKLSVKKFLHDEQSLINKIFDYQEEFWLDAIFQMVLCFASIKIIRLNRSWNVLYLLLLLAHKEKLVSEENIVSQFYSSISGMQFLDEVIYVSMMNEYLPIFWLYSGGQFYPVKLRSMTQVIDIVNHLICI